MPLYCLVNLEAKSISSDKVLNLLYSLRNKLTSLVREENVNPPYTTQFDNLWYFGIITEVNTEEGDLTVKFLHPVGPSLSFH